MNIDRNKWRPITVEELQQLSYEEREKLLSYCWKYGEPRCWCIGIRGVEITEIMGENFKKTGSFKLSWSDEDGDPSIFVRIDQKIDNISNDRYSHGLYKEIS